MEAYFDNAATTKVFPEVKDLVVKLMEEDYGILPPCIRKVWMQDTISRRRKRFLQKNGR